MLSFINFQLPRRAWPIWLATLALPVVQVATTIVYHVRELESGVLPPDGDSIMIPIVHNLIGTIMIMPILLLMTILCVLNYSGEGRIFSIDGTRLARSTILTAVFALLIVLIVYVAISDLQAALREPYPFALEATIIVWLLLLRASVVFSIKRPRQKAVPS